jgi:hypothetical protein
MAAIVDTIATSSSWSMWMAAFSRPRPAHRPPRRRSRCPARPVTRPRVGLGERLGRPPRAERGADAALREAPPTLAASRTARGICRARPAGDRAACDGATAPDRRRAGLHRDPADAQRAGRVSASRLPHPLGRGSAGAKGPSRCRGRARAPRENLGVPLRPGRWPATQEAWVVARMFQRSVERGAVAGRWSTLAQLEAIAGTAPTGRGEVPSAVRGPRQVTRVN